MKRSKLIIGVLAVLAAILAVVFVLDKSAGEMPRPEREILVKEYIQENISALSPQSEVLGGTFYVTEIEFTGESTGTVFYEDGHIAIMADFEYGVDSAGTAEVTLFNVRDKVDL